MNKQTRGKGLQKCARNSPNYNWAIRQALKDGPKWKHALQVAFRRLIPAEFFARSKEAWNKRGRRYRSLDTVANDILQGRLRVMARLGHVRFTEFERCQIGHDKSRYVCALTEKGMKMVTTPPP